MKRKNQQQISLKSQLKRLFAIVVFISVITQINIAITGAIKAELKKNQIKNQIKKEILNCPPDCCTLTADVDEYELTQPPKIELLDIDVKPIPVK